MQATIAVIGAGRWGQNLIKNFAQLGVLSAIVDCDLEKGAALASQYQVRFFDSVTGLLETAVQAVAIATPVFSHYEVAKQALLAGKDVFVEKPMTTTVAEADELIAIAKSSNRILMVGHLLLYQPAIQFIKDFLNNQQLGQLYAIRQYRRSLGTIRREENVLYSLGVHDLAVLDYLVSETVDTISAASHHLINADIADDMSLNLGYGSGLQAHIHLSWLWPVKDRQLMLLGTHGALHFNELTQQVTFYQNYGNPDASITQKGHDVIFVDTTPPLMLELTHFLDCIQERTQPRSCGEQGRTVVKLMADIMDLQR